MPHQGRSGLRQQGHQAAAAVQVHQVIAATDVRTSNKNLGHGTPPRDFHHVRPLIRVGVNANFLNVLHTLGFKNALGLNAVWADCGGVHLDGLHTVVCKSEMSKQMEGIYAFSTGKLAVFHAERPPPKEWTCSKPSFWAVATARDERIPD